MEINCDIGFIFSRIVENFIFLLQSSFTESLMTGLGTSNFFFVFGTVSGLSIIFFVFCIGETKHLTDKEKKQLYMPGKAYGRKLRAGEQPTSTRVDILTAEPEVYGISDSRETSLSNFTKVSGRPSEPSFQEQR